MLPPPPRERIVVPPSSPPPPRAPFPWAATLAPVVVALGLWIFTQSVYSLVFALLGPLVAAGGLVDGRRGRRRAARREAERSGTALERVRVRIAAAQRQERERLSGMVLLPAAARWDGDDGEPVPVRVGSGEATSAVELSGDDPDDPRHDILREAAAGPADAPVVVDARDGIGVVGPPVLAAAIARALAVQVNARLSPVHVTVTAAGDEDWIRALPHETVLAAGGAYRWQPAEGSPISIAWAQADDDLPAGCGVRVTASPALSPHALSRAEAQQAARVLAQRADELGSRPRAAVLPRRVALREVLPPSPGQGLSAVLGIAEPGPLVVDLVAQGPHALIAGTTGSGKSELLIAWILAMADGRSPDQVTFLLIDFKGGAAFAPLAGLPHVVATLSDLDPRLTRRAIESLRAEVLRRERLLAREGVRAIDELPAGTLARLVVVVDEFAALVSAGPDLHEVFADLAARGRSLGLHLILCTQRPAGVVRDAVLANIGLRLSLRVTDRGDSLAMLGVDGAARLPAEPRGRAIVAVDGTTLEVQLALADPGDAGAIAGATPAGVTVRPWCDPLPASIDLDDVRADGPGIPFGLADLPAEQRQPVAVHDPARHGHLLVAGGPRSGVTTALTTLAESARRSGVPVQVISADPADAWAQLTELAAPRSADGPALVVADDLDALLARFSDDHRAGVVDVIGSLLRDTSPGAPSLAVGVRRMAGAFAGVSGLFGSRLVLRLATRDEHMLCGGEAGEFDPGLPPGAGWWRGAVVQVALASGVSLPQAVVPLPRRVSPADHAVLAIIAARPPALLESLTASGARVVQLGRDATPDPARLHVTTGAAPTVLLGDPDAWQAEWTLLTSARRGWPLVFVGCGTGDVRALLRERETPPPLGTGQGECWLAAGGRTVRAVLDLTTRESEEKHPANR